MNINRFKYRIFHTEEYPVPEMRGKMVYCEDGLDYDACVEGVKYGSLVIMFCIGQEDCTGKLIYEGDITQLEQAMGFPETTYIVLWDKAGFVTLNGNGTKHGCYNESNTIVIGNIYQNPYFSFLAPCHHKYISDRP